MMIVYIYFDCDSHTSCLILSICGGDISSLTGVGGDFLLFSFSFLVILYMLYIHFWNISIPY